MFVTKWHLQKNCNKTDVFRYRYRYGYVYIKPSKRPSDKVSKDDKSERKTCAFMQQI